MKLIPSFKKLLAVLAALLAALAFAAPAAAANCNYATSQGATGPANWQTYCWLDLSGYSDSTARSGSGQNFSYTLPDGTTMTFNMKVSGAAVTGAASPSWSGAAVGNTAFLGIAGRPVLYQTAAGTTTVQITGITLTPPSGSSAITSYMFVAGDAESSNGGESLTFQTNGANWVQLDQVGPTSGSTYPTIAGVGTSTVTTTGVGGTVGAYIFGSATPTAVTSTLVGSGLQGAMFAVRFASIRLNLQIAGARVQAADQFKFDIKATSSGSVLASGTSTGTGLGPFTAAALSSSSALPLTLTQAMASGSSSGLGQYQSKLSCTNSAVSSTALPTNVVTTAYNFGTLQFGDNVQCLFTNTPYPHLQLTKALGSTGRQYASDQFVMSIAQGTTTLSSTTTTGSGSTIATGSTALLQVNAATAYRLGEAGAGATSLTQYIPAMSCTNSWTASTTTLPGGAVTSGTITPRMGDVIRCTITNTKRGTNASLSVTKLSFPVSDPVNGTANPKLIPGAVVNYMLSVANTGPSPVDSNSVVLIDSLPAQIAVGTAASPTFTQGSVSSSLTFNSATDIRYSNAATAPASFAACTYSPTGAYDSAVRYICINPKGTMAGSTGTPPSFSISFNSRIN
ncbi:CshA/CshB family fibrillar adhesin-related protein [Novosphingobium sp. B 225]|uniref:CshA/CshB family fibrillar adhesin-related protein n=1 Tax=Novosphingobium sp. B 225 TaxID=1961849 RepID=UPI0020CC06DB|nr:CshA/CshB family fibrillar adhesin-related protein [Novosphingobium sp. B 225]